MHVKERLDIWRTFWTSFPWWKLFCDFFILPVTQKEGRGRVGGGCVSPQAQGEELLCTDLHPPAQKSRGKESQDKGEWHSLCWGQGHMSASCETAMDYMGEREPAWSHVGSWRSSGMPIENLCAVGHQELGTNWGISWQSEVRGLPLGYHSWILAGNPKKIHEGVSSEFAMPRELKASLRS